MFPSRSLLRVGRNGLLNRITLCSGFSLARSKSSLWYPDYLDAAKSQFPEYPPMNIQIKGYDYVILEKFQQKIHKTAKRLKLIVSDTWAQECEEVRVVLYKPKSIVVKCEYLMKIYERNIQVSNVYSYEMPLLIELITSFCPVGVKIRIHPHEQEHFEKRFVPEVKLLELQQQLEELKKK